jgi:hypothetical protein
MSNHVEPSRVGRDYKISIAYAALKNITLRQETAVSGMINTVKAESYKEVWRSALGVVNAFGAHVDHLARDARKTNPTRDVFDSKLLLNVEVYLKSTQEKLSDEDPVVAAAFNEIIQGVIKFFRIYSRTGHMPESFADV